MTKDSLHGIKRLKYRHSKQSYEVHIRLIIVGSCLQNSFLLDFYRISIDEYFQVVLFLLSGCITDDDYSWVCSHIRGYYYFRESLLQDPSTGCEFRTRKCENYDDYETGRCFDEGKSCDSDPECGSMGFYADKRTGRGRQFVQTVPRNHLMDSGFCGI